MSECEELCSVSKYTSADRETDDTVSVVTGHDNSVAATLDYDVGVDNNDNNDDK